MSDGHEHSAIRADVVAKLAQYDQTREPSLLLYAGDQISSQDGAVSASPEQAKLDANQRIELWAELFARFKRDLDPNFDPDKAPTLQVMPPPFKGMQLPPGTPPTSIQDPEWRRQYERDIADNKSRISSFALQNKLHEAHSAMLERAANSIRDAREKGGLSADEIRAGLAKSDVLPADRDALAKAAAP